MKRNLNLIATAASLILLGLSGESHAFQNYQDPLVGSGLLSEDKIGKANIAPVIVKGDRKLISELKPLTMPKLKQFPNPAQLAADPSGAVGAGSRLLNQPQDSTRRSGRLPDAGYGSNSGIPPIIKSTSRRLSQATTANYAAPVIQGGQSEFASQDVLALPSIVTPATAAPVRPAAYSQGSSTRSVPGSSTRTPVPGSSTRAPLPPIESSGVPFSAGAPDVGVPSVLQQPFAASQQTPEYFSAGPALSLIHI